MGRKGLCYVADILSFLDAVWLSSELPAEFYKDYLINRHSNSSEACVKGLMPSVWLEPLKPREAPELPESL